MKKIVSVLLALVLTASLFSGAALAENKKLSVQNHGTFPEVLAVELFFRNGFPVLQVHGADGALPELAGGLIEHAVVEEQSLGVSRLRVGIFLHHFGPILLHLRLGAGGNQERAKYDCEFFHVCKDKQKSGIIGHFFLARAVDFVIKAS